MGNISLLLLLQVAISH